MTDKLGGKAGNIHKEGGATFDTGGIELPTVAYREFYALAKELGMKNSEYFKPFTSVVVDPNVACFFAQGFNVCNLATLSSEAFGALMPAVQWGIVRALLLMQADDINKFFSNN